MFKNRKNLVSVSLLGGKQQRNVWKDHSYLSLIK